MKILLATDGSEFSNAAARTIAEQFRPQDNEVRVLTVVEPRYHGGGAPYGSGLLSRTRGKETRG